MASAPGPFPVVKTKKWIFDSVEAPTIYHSIACASAFSSMLANEHEEFWRQLANRTISDIQIKHPTHGTIPSTLSLDTDPISDTFPVGLMNNKKQDEIKWINLLEYIKDNKLEALVLTEQL